MQTVTIERLQLNKKVAFEQKGYEFTYKTEFKMKGVAVLKDSKPRIERKLSFLVGEGTICLEHAGIWQLIPDREHVKLSQNTYLIDTSVPTHVNLAPSFILLAG